MKPFHFKQFSIEQDQCAMKVTLDACLFGALCAQSIDNPQAIESTLDIGAGTGLLSLMVAQKKISNIKAIELDTAAAEQAKRNVLNSPFFEQIEVIESNILDYQTDTLFDLIISNPPFFSDHLKGPNPERNQARHNDGLSFDSLCQIIKNKLCKEGVAWLILPCNEFQRFKSCMENEALACSDVYSIKNNGKKAPHRTIFSIKHNTEIREKAVETTIRIRADDASDYTDDFKALLKNYYQKL